jgi:exodeoxyribonuclease X
MDEAGMSGRAYIFDTELTDRRDGEIIEAALIRIAEAPDLFGGSDEIDPKLQADGTSFGRYRPSKPVAFGSMAVHHILPLELEQCRPSSEFELAGDCGYLIGHSIDFDWKAAGSPAHVKRICTHAMAQWLWPDATGYSQSALLYMLLGATHETRELLRKAHCALDDAHNNLTLLGHILALKPEIRTWSQLWEYSEECRIPRTCPMKRNEGVLLEDLDDGFIQWCLGQHWLDPYFRKGLERIIENRYPRQNSDDGTGELFDADDDEEWP